MTTVLTTPTETSRDPSLFLDGVLVDLRIGWWRGKVPLAPQDLGIDPESVPNIFQLGRKLVIPPESLTSFERAYNKAHYALKQFTFPFPTGNARFIPYGVLPEVMQYVTDAERTFRVALAKFTANYDDYRKQMIDAYPEHVEALSKAEMKTIDLEKHFHFKYSVYQVVLPKNIKFAAIQASDAVADAEAKRKAAIEAEESYRAQFDEQLDEFLNSSVGSLRAAIGDAVSNIAERLAAGDVITKGSVDSLKRTIERFKMLNFVGDAEVEFKLDELTKLIPASSKDFKEQEIRAGFEKGIQSVMSSLIESDIAKATNEYKRKVRI